MNKRQVIHDLIDKLLDIQESSKKVVFFNYSGHVDWFDYTVRKNAEAFSVKFLDIRTSGKSIDNGEFDINHALSEIEEISLVLDEPVEKMVNVQLPESRAKELGLIA